MESMPMPISRKKCETLSGCVVPLLENSLRELREKAQPADLFLKKVFRSEHKFGSRDRRFISQCLFAFYRWHGWLAKTFPPETPPEKLLLGAFAAEGILPLAAEVWCEKIGLDPDSYRKIFTLDSPEHRFDSFAGSPAACSPRDLIPAHFLPYLAPGAESHFLPALYTRPPVWIRIQKHTDRVLREFAEKNIQCEKDPRLPAAYRLGNHAGVNLLLLETFRDGCFELQDFASQCIGYAALGSEQGHWWDACAGAGGKTLLLASLLGKNGVVTAGDIREKKMEEMRERAERGGFRNIRILPFEEGLKGEYDGVLADVPCSSSGRWRRNPEMKLAATETWIRELADLQLEILEKVSRRVRKGGVLIYGTCSVFDCENTGVVRRFLERNPAFEPDAFPYNGQQYTALQTFPDEADCDGTFRARFRRVK